MSLVSNIHVHGWVKGGIVSHFIYIPKFIINNFTVIFIMNFRNLADVN